ncbi:MAG: GTPase Era, partial [Chloroflexi bacterium]|nr:GTPase Era [Chloroflexota bacterium]
MHESPAPFRSGFVAIVGRPNVGKSTLLNYLAKRKIAIISEKPQTTRFRIQAVVNVPNAQIILIDTPGLHKPRDPLGEKLNEAVRNAYREVDAIIFLTDAAEGIGGGDSFIAAELAHLKTPVILALNKIDRISGGALEAQAVEAEKLGEFGDIIPISAVKGENLQALIDRILELLPEGPRYYPQDMLTDQPENMVIAEFIREKILGVTEEEVPHSVAVAVEDITPRKGKDLVDVSAIIYVERESQKGIIIGKGGSKLKQIGRDARLEIEHLLGSQIYLYLRVKVKKEWRRDEAFVRRFGSR